MNMYRTIHIVALAGLALWPAVSAAQQPPNATPQVTPKIERHDDPNACAHTRATVGQGGGVDVQRQPGQTLSDKLAQSNGVICPPANTDPDIKAPAPEGGALKVIPPPGSPGGNPQVQPK